jgi:hypothetical protein
MKALKRILRVFALLTLAAAVLPGFVGCEKHDADVTRAFYDLDYEHKLHKIGEVPQYNRFYYPGSLTAKEAANLADYQEYISKLRRDPLNPPVPGMETRDALVQVLEDDPAAAHDLMDTTVDVVEGGDEPAGPEQNDPEIRKIRQTVEALKAARGQPRDAQPQSAE